jgi:hypothetical protein
MTGLLRRTASKPAGGSGRGAPEDLLSWPRAATGTPPLLSPARWLPVISAAELSNEPAKAVAGSEIVAFPRDAEPECIGPASPDPVAPVAEF